MYDTTLWIIAIPFGLIVGSFLNVAILRMNTGMTLGGRSQCFACGTSLTWLDLVPVFSFLFLRARCRTCRAPISWQYPLVELLTAGLFGLLTFVYPPISWVMATVWLINIIVACLMVIIFVYDIRHKIIPDSLVYTFIILSLILILINGASFGTLLAGPLLFLPFALLWLFSKGRAIGFGDAKLALGMGWFLGLVGGVSAVILGVWIGALVSVASMVYIRLCNYFIHRNRSSDKSTAATIKPSLSMLSEVPFAPYLIIGLYISLVTSVDVLNLRFLLESILGL